MGWNLEEMLGRKPYCLEKEEKHLALSKRLLGLSIKHYNSCGEYKRIVDAFGIDLSKITSYYKLPFLPVRLFKELDLQSVPTEDIVKVITSSGTSNQKVSKVYIDKKTAVYQQKTLVKLVSSFTGKNRMPMLIIDCPSVIKDRAKFSARGAGILGFSIFGREKLYALNDDMKLDVEGIKSFLERHKGETIFMFGFTFMIWQYFYKELLRLKKDGIELNLSDGILIHGGGWKRLANEAVSQKEFRESLCQVCGLRNIHDYYGMAEQTGCIYMQCEYGHLHTSIFSDVIMRRPVDFSVCGIGEKGIIQVVSALPESYPGHSLLTEDEGIILGEDDCPCGRKGKYFSVTGRLKSAEIRGCSDTYAVKF
jgi:phenylacetate-coenzyme A ligase PaaK-like adenylate-forming protein